MKSSPSFSNYCWSFKWLKLRLYHTSREDSTRLRLMKRGGGVGALFKFCSWWLPLVPAWILRGFTSRLHLPSTFYKDRYSSNSATSRVPGFSTPLFPFINFSHFYFHALMDLSASPFSICFHIFPIYTSVPSWIFKNFRLSPTSCFFATSHLVSTSSPPSIV